MSPDLLAYIEQDFMLQLKISTQNFSIYQGKIVYMLSAYTTNSKFLTYSIDYL